MHSSAVVGSRSKRRDAPKAMRCAASRVHPDCPSGRGSRTRSRSARSARQPINLARPLRLPDRERARVECAHCVARRRNLLAGDDDHRTSTRRFVPDEADGVVNPTMENHQRDAPMQGRRGLAREHDLDVAHERRPALERTFDLAHHDRVHAPHVSTFGATVWNTCARIGLESAQARSTPQAGRAAL